MILGFDIGNTSTTLGIYNQQDISPAKTFRFNTERGITSEKFEPMIKNFINQYRDEINTRFSVTGIAFSSVVPEVNRFYHKMSENLYNITPLEIDCHKTLGISIHYDNPEELGCDRIVNAVAAYNEYMRDCIIIDLGTATTFCVLLKEGIFDGGIIAPGIGITIDALANKTSQLVKVNFEKCEKLVARNAIDAIKSGFFYGWISLVEGIINRIEKQYGKIFLPLITGGFADLIGSNMERDCFVDYFLTMKGIKYIYNMNY